MSNSFFVFSELSAESIIINFRKNLATIRQPFNLY
jgi:hypothetical protein